MLSICVLKLLKLTVGLW